MTVSLDVGDAAGETFLTAERGPHTITMPAASREQLLIEAITVDSLAGLIEWFLGHVARSGDGQTVAVGFTADAQLWSTTRG